MRRLFPPLLPRQLPEVLPWTLTLRGWFVAVFIQLTFFTGWLITELERKHLGMDHCQVGSMIAVAMPPADAFGEEGNPGLGLPAGVDLIAVIDVVGVY